MARLAPGNPVGNVDGCKSTLPISSEVNALGKSGMMSSSEGEQCIWVCGALIEENSKNGRCDEGGKRQS